MLNNSGLTGSSLYEPGRNGLPFGRRAVLGRNKGYHQEGKSETPGIHPDLMPLHRPLPEEIGEISVEEGVTVRAMVASNHVPDKNTGVAIDRYRKKEKKPRCFPFPLRDDRDKPQDQNPVIICRMAGYYP